MHYGSVMGLIFGENAICRRSAVDPGFEKRLHVW